MSFAVRGWRSTWKPTDLGGSLKAWWSADDHGTASMTDDGGGLISAWVDRVAGISMAAAAAERPTWSAAALNGKPGLTFDGVANCFANTSFAALPTGANASEIWAVVDYTGGGSARAIFTYGGISAGQLRRLNSTGAGFYQVGDATTTLIDTAVAAAGIRVVGGIFTGANLEGRVAGRDFNPASTALVPATGTTRARIGASNNTAASLFWQGVIRHVLVTGALTGGERLKMEGYLAWDVASQSMLVGGHAYIDGVP